MLPVSFSCSQCSVPARATSCWEHAGRLRTGVASGLAGDCRMQERCKHRVFRSPCRCLLVGSSLIFLGSLVKALQELILPRCSGAGEGEDTDGPFHLSLCWSRTRSQDLRSSPRPHPATLRIHPPAAKGAQASRFCQQAPAGYPLGKTRLIY